MQPNVLVEPEIARLDRVMGTFVFGRVSAATAYWPNRLDALWALRHLTDYQRCWVQELMRELPEPER